jgi:hypothetical protein
VLRWSGFAMAAFIVGVMLTGFARGPVQPVTASACHESELAAPTGCELAVRTETR